MILHSKGLTICTGCLFRTFNLHIILQINTLQTRQKYIPIGKGFSPNFGERLQTPPMSFFIFLLNVKFENLTVGL